MITSTYETRKLQNLISQIASDGYDFVDVIAHDSDENHPASLEFSAIDLELDAGVDYEPIESCDIEETISNDSSNQINPNDLCNEICFTYDEIFCIQQAIGNALEYAKECQKSSEYTKEQKRNMKSDSVPIRNIQAKLNQFIKHLRFE